MDPVRNPFAPGAGTPPPELAGRDELREQVRVAIERVRGGRPTKSVLMVGLRGVGKTVLLDRMRDDAEGVASTRCASRRRKGARCPRCWRRSFARRCCAFPRTRAQRRWRSAR
jgi:hypothetical protein